MFDTRLFQSKSIKKSFEAVPPTALVSGPALSSSYGQPQDSCGLGSCSPSQPSPFVFEMGLLLDLTRNKEPPTLNIS